MSDITVVYFTSNREDPRFEKNIQRTLTEAIGDLPLISVSQKPIDFGKNICVGDIGANQRGLLHQLKVGAKAATTKFIATTEADCLFHKSYFEFNPTREDVIYRPDLIYVMWIKHPHYFYPKRRKYVEGITGRDHIISVIDTIENKLSVGQFNYVDDIFEGEAFHPEIPVITFKTGRGMHLKAPYSKNNRTSRLSYWGRAKQLAKTYVDYE